MREIDRELLFNLLRRIVELSFITVGSNSLPEVNPDGDANAALADLFYAVNVVRRFDFDDVVRLCASQDEELLALIFDGAGGNDVECGSDPEGGSICT